MEKKWIHLVLIGGLCVSANAISQGGGIVNIENKQASHSFKPLAEIELGSGTLKNSKLPTHNKCLKKMPVRYSDFKSTLSFSSTTSTEALAKSLNVDFKAKAGWSKFSASAQASYIKSAKEDEHSLSFHYQNIISGYASMIRDDYYGENALNEAGKAALNDGIDQFIETCGDTYLRGMDMGAVLNVTVKINFQNEIDKRLFEASIEGKLGDAFSASANIKQTLDSNRISGTIDVMAYQAGGDPNLLASIFGEGKEHPIIRCNIQAMDQCAKALDEILSYAQATGAWKETGFAKQIKIKDGKLEASTLEPIGLFDSTFSSYKTDFGIPIPRNIPTDDVLRARTEINSLYDNYEEELNRAKSVINSLAFAKLSDDIKREIRSIHNALESNFSLVSSPDIMDCFLPGTQDTCPMILSKIQSSSIDVNKSTLDLLRGAYFVNINFNWPLIWIKNKNETLDIYDITLKNGIGTNLLKVTPNYNYSFLSLGGGYSYIDTQGRKVRLYMDYYGAEGLVYRKNNGIYSGLVPWNTCVNGNCSKAYYDLKIIPF